MSYGEDRGPPAGAVVILTALAMSVVAALAAQCGHEVASACRTKVVQFPVGGNVECDPGATAKIESVDGTRVVICTCGGSR
jgi:hypothetical protein